MVTRLTRPLEDPRLVIVGDRCGEHGWQPGQELWRVPFRGWGEVHELRAEVQCVPRRYTVLDDLVRDAGYCNDPVCLPGEVFRIRVASPLAA